MSQIKIYARKATINQHRDGLSTAIHDALIEALSYPPEKKFQRFIALDAADFIYPADRSDAYTIIEISMFVGRSKEAKKSLVKHLFENIRERTGIAPHDIEITIFETPQENWGVRGQCGDDLMLNYKVSV
ncbi:tautomerase [Formosimonas limnophila]|uniref:Tautomerase n=1 Tax=Formosimonas limnophila TaxID=1384487 RepID=A0A8J3G0U0_9BURK|nr:tautomerase family protein [Formosimonas limnophila]GHA75572.1 tautomerase [Formosimonas limnophila]